MAATAILVRAQCARVWAAGTKTVRKPAGVVPAAPPAAEVPVAVARVAQQGREQPVRAWMETVLRETLPGIEEHRLACVVLRRPACKASDEHIKHGFHLQFPWIFLRKDFQKQRVLPLVREELDAPRRCAVSRAQPDQGGEGGVLGPFAAALGPFAAALAPFAYEDAAFEDASEDA